MIRTPVLFALPLLSLLVTAVACSGGGGSTPTSSDAGADSSSSLPSNVTPVDVTFSATCPRVTPCGGSVVGTWDYSAVCIDDPLASFKKQCPSATVQSQKGTVKGRVVFDASTVSRTSNVAYQASFSVPAECSAGQCALVQDALAKSFDTAKCAAAGGGCACDVTLATTTSQTDAYTVSDHTVKIADGATYDFCISGSKFAYVPSGQATEPGGAYEMTKK